MKTHPASLTGRVTLTALLSIIAFTFAAVALLPTDSQSAQRRANKTKQSQAVSVAANGGGAANLAAISAPIGCTTPTTVVSDNTPNDATDHQANHDIVSTSVCTTSADPDKAY